MLRFLKKFDFWKTDIHDLIPWEYHFANWINFSHKVGCIPIKYNKTTSKFHVTTNPFVYYIWLLRIFLLLLDNIYLSTQFRNVTTTSVDAEEFMNFYVHALSRITASFMTISVAFGLEGTVYLFNVIYKTRIIWLNHNRFKNWSFPFTGSVCNKFTRLVKFGLLFIYVQSFAPLALHFQNRYSRRYWPGQYLPKYLYNCWIFVLLEGLNDLHLSMMSIYCVCYVSILAVSLFITVTYYTGCIT